MSMPSSPKDWDNGTGISGRELQGESTLTVQAGESFSIGVNNATDSDHWILGNTSGNINETVTYRWTAALGTTAVGGFTDTTQPGTYWTAPATPGTYVLTITMDDPWTGLQTGVTNPETGIRNDPPLVRTVTVHVVNIEKLRYRFTAQDSWKDVTDTISIPAHTSLEFQAIKDPATAPGWPDNKPVWAKNGNSEGTHTEPIQSFDFGAAGTYSTTAQCGNLKTAIVTAVEMASMAYRIDLPGTADDTGPMIPVLNTIPIPVPLGTTVVFKALKNSPSAKWPDDKPTWRLGNNDIGSGETTSITFDTLSNSATDYQEVTAQCDNTVVAKMIVFKADIKVRRKDEIESDYLDSIVLAAGGKSPKEHKAEVLIQVTPILPGLLVPTPTIVGGESALGANTPGAAVLSIGNTTTNAEGKVITNAEGKAYFAYLSSNTIKNSILVQLKWGTVMDSATINQHWNDINAWGENKYFFYGQPLGIKLTPKFSAGESVTIPITAHKMNFIIVGAHVWVWDEQIGQFTEETYVPFNTSLNPLLPMKIMTKEMGHSNLDLVTISPWNRRPDDVESGLYTSSLTVEHRRHELVDRVEFRAQDDESYRDR